MAAMFQAQSANWEETQEKMSHATHIFNASRGPPRSGSKPVPSTYQPPDSPLPASYVCYRCGQKGHWIKDCPTNSDREFDHKPRIKRTTSIPRSMLKAVENINNGELGQGVIDNKLFRDAVKTPCCGTCYCEDCIQTHLLERYFICPNCGKKLASLDKLVPDLAERRRVGDHFEKAIEESREAAATEEMEDEAKETINLEQDFYSDQQPGIDVQQMLVQIQAQISQKSVMLQNPSLPLQVRQQTDMQHEQLKMQLQQGFAIAEYQQQQQQAQQIQMQNMQQQQQGAMGGGIGFNNMAQGWVGASGSGSGSGGAGGNLYPAQGGLGQAGQESAYQRLPVNHRRRNLKRDRPSDFLEIGNGAIEGDAKVARYWE